MNSLTQLFKINGLPMPAPDENVQMSFEDLDAAEAGRDESGVMHRLPVRYKVGSWKFVYTGLDQEEMAYLLRILPQEGSFLFTHPSLTDCTQTQECRAYLSGFSVVWHSAKTGAYRDLKFSVIQC